MQFRLSVEAASRRASSVSGIGRQPRLCRSESSGVKTSEVHSALARSAVVVDETTGGTSDFPGSKIIAGQTLPADIMVKLEMVGQ